MSEKQAIIDALRHQSCELRDLDVGWSVPRLPLLSSLEFLRDYVACNKPVIFTDAISHWPALTQWTKEYLIQKAGNDPVTVALTPNGRADCPTRFPSTSSATPTATAASETPDHDQLCFALPYECKTSLATFFNLLETSLVDTSAPVPYMQFQNSSLTKELPHLVADVSPELPFASEAFGCSPEAVNLWIGGTRTITSWHKDHYENLYAMVSGRKSFRLLPPSDSYRMNQKRFPTATWHLIPRKVDSKSSSTSTTSTQLEDRSSIDANHLNLLIEEELESGKLELKLNHPETAAAVAAGETIDIGRVGEDYITWSAITPTPLTSWSSGPFSDPWGKVLSIGGVGIQKKKEKEINLYDDPDLPKPLVVTLEPGEVLYLPACWWHEVHHTTEDVQGRSDDGNSDEDCDDRNDGVAIAVNYWYDQKYDVKHVHMKTVEQLARIAGLYKEEMIC